MAPLTADVLAGQWRQRGTLAAAGMLRTSPTPQANPRLSEELTDFIDGNCWKWQPSPAEATGRRWWTGRTSQRRGPASIRTDRRRVAAGGRDGQDVSDFRDVVLHQMHFRLQFNKSHVHVHADGKAAGRKGPVQRLVERTDKSGVLGEASGRDGRRGRPVEDFGHDVVSGLLGLFRFTVRHDVTGRPGLFDVAAERLDRRNPGLQVATHSSLPLSVGLLLGGR